MRVILICSNFEHPVYSYLVSWKNLHENTYDITLAATIDEVSTSGDILFLVSCSEYIGADVRRKFKNTLVLHASDLPEGRGWSPHVWDTIFHKKRLTVSLINAEDKIDTGDVWKKVHIDLNGTELYDEINAQIFDAEIKLISWACENISSAIPTKQRQDNVSYYRMRTPADSELDIHKSINQQFDLIRVCDPDRYPAFFYYHGKRYKLKIERYEDE